MPTLKTPVTNKDHEQGNEKALITLVEYGDYECPHCAKANEIVKALQKQFQDQLLYVFRNFPLAELHPHAEIAAEAAEFAGEHGLFWEMHDLIFDNQAGLSLPTLLKLANELGLSSEALKTALEKGTYKAKVKKEFLDGARSGVNGTPTYFINGERYNGPNELESIAETLQSKSA